MEVGLPDFLYACGQKFSDSHDAAEAAHWPAFQAIAIRYLRRKTKNFTAWPLSERDEKLTAFIFGLSVHYVTDEVWEGLASDQINRRGFIELTNSMNRGKQGRGDMDEGIGNMGADFYASWILNESSVKPFSRYFPIDDLVEIYHETPHAWRPPGNKGPAGNFTNVTKLMLSKCAVLFDLGLWALKSFGKILFPWWNRQKYMLPMHQEHLLDMPLSGIEDMASLVTFEWARIGSWIDQGPPSGASVPIKQSPRKQLDEAEDDRDTSNLLRALRLYAISMRPPCEKCRRRKLPSFSPRVSAEMFKLDEVSGETVARIEYGGPDHLFGAVSDVLRVVLEHYGARMDIVNKSS